VLVQFSVLIATKRTDVFVEHGYTLIQRFEELADKKTG